MASGNCQKYEINSINSIRKNNHKIWPTLYPSRQMHTFDLDDRYVNGQTDRRTDGNYTSSYIRLYHVIHWIFYVLERKPIAFASII